MVDHHLSPLASPLHNIFLSYPLHNFLTSRVDAIVTTPAPPPLANILVSTTTIQCLLTLLYRGAGGSTAEEILRAIEIHHEIPLPICVKGNTSETVNLDTKLYLKSGIAIKDDYKEFLASRWIQHQGVNFANGEETSEIINAWIKNKTSNQIPSLIPPGDFDSQTGMVFASVSYFNGAWKFPFNKTKTRPLPFYTANRPPVDVEVMNQIQTLKSGPIPGVDADVLLLPYEGNRTTLVVILPNEVDGLNKIKGQLFRRGFIAFREKLLTIEERLTNVLLPKFNFTHKIDMVNELRTQFNLSVSFDPDRANFSGISDSPLYLSYARSTTSIYVDEEGTKADSATEFQIDEAPEADVAVQRSFIEIPSFRADHPFLFFLMPSDLTDLPFLGHFETL